MSIYDERIKTLQGLMKKANLSAFIMPSADIHFNEYLPECFMDRAFMSGFTGSAGTLIVLENEAHLFTDGRYWLQAEKELSQSAITLQKQTKEHTYPKFLIQKLKKGSFVGINSKNLSMNSAKELKKFFKSANLKLEFADLLAMIFNPRPALPKHLIFEHKNIFTGTNSKNKLKALRQKMSEKNASYHFISSLDDIAWITNLRGLDIAYNPVFLSFLLLSFDKALLFVNRAKLKPNLALKLEKQGFTLYEYEEVESILHQLKKEKILLDTQKTSIYFAKILKKHNKIIKATNPSTLLKAHKNAKELKNIKNAMIADALSLCEFFAWFEKAVKKGLDELDIDEKLSAFRAKHPLYLCNSFATIAGFNANAAIIHYQATAQNHAKIQGNGLLLIDSGAQYQNGTTDITRVVGVGELNQAQKRDYTLVLKALIALSRAKFPKNTALSSLDSLARANLWQEGLEYMHGTGHGVGYFLNVHEAPISISSFSNAHNKAEIGIISSIEPGIYRKDKWGIRLENLVVIVLAKTKERDFGEFLRFETLTLCPFERLLIDFTLLDSKEKAWLNAYHQKILKTLSPKLKGEALKWLVKKCAKLI